MKMKTYYGTHLKELIKINELFTVHYFEYVKDFAYSGEFHDFWELVYADKKNLLITAGAQEVELEAGQIYVHKPNEFHAVRTLENTPANFIICSFDCKSPLMQYFEHKILHLLDSRVHRHQYLGK